MNSQLLRRSLDAIAKVADFLQAPFALIARVYVSWVFLNSGYLKITDWEQTRSLFEDVYHVPVLSPLWAAIMGTAGELGFSLFVILGLGGRLPAIGLFFVNAMAVISFQDVLLSDDGIAGLRQHELWGFILLMLIVYGPGSWSLDNFLTRRQSR
ncbi:MAG TPA: DoxX family protein [Steroidobacteraceae bacterium]|nr:DoxX family protein [Steroidobacteraceae bacterium]